jgi:hypothetical protein
VRRMSSLTSRLRRRLTFANVTSVGALFVALGGTSYAAIRLPANSVGADQIRTGAVGTPEIKTGGVASREIKTGGVGASELRTDSVRAREIKQDAVTSAEIAKGAVGTDEIKDGSIDAADVSAAARSALGSVAFRAAVSAAGAAVSGNPANAALTTDPGVYTVDFGRDVSACVPVATLAAVTSGTTTDVPDPGRVTVARGTAASSVVVRTFGPAGAAANEPFHLVVAC